MKGGSNISFELPEAGVLGCSPQLLRDFQYFNESKLKNLLYFMQKKSTLIIMHINTPAGADPGAGKGRGGAQTGQVVGGWREPAADFLVS